MRRGTQELEGQQPAPFFDDSTHESDDDDSDHRGDYG